MLIIKIKYVSKLGRLRDTFVDIYNTVGKCYYVEIIVRTHIHKQYPLGERFEFLFRVITTVALMCNRESKVRCNRSIDRIETMRELKCS